MRKRELTLDEIKKKEIQILDYIDEVCRKNNLMYFLGGGTLLGAIRHKGFIPWDDDIDINMLRPDYEKLLNILSDCNGKYKLLCYKTSDKYLYPFAKVVDTETETYDNSPLPGCGLFVDIFPIDGLPATEKECKKIQDKTARIRGMLGYSYNNISSYKKVTQKLKCLLCKCIGSKRLLEKLNNAATSYDVNEADYLANIAAGVKKYRKIRKGIYEHTTKVEFEGKKYTAPLEYDEYLTGLYGNYMKLPPVEKRVSNHQIKAYILEK